VTLDIEIFGQLLPGEPRQRTKEFTGPETARKVAESIGLNTEEVGLVMINGVQSGLDDPIQSDSRLCFFPYVTGG
jgi:molybdopterin converting factor small subunit